MQDGPTLIPVAQENPSHEDLYSGKAESSRQQKLILGQDKEEPMGLEDDLQMIAHALNVSRGIKKGRLAPYYT